MEVPAGVEPPAPDDLDDVGKVHAVDGDSTAFCNGDLALEQVDHQAWAQVPEAQRCFACATMLTGLAG